MNKERKGLKMNDVVLTVMVEENEIGKAQALFIDRMTDTASKHEIIMVGYKGESDQHEAFWSKELGIWWVSEKSENRYWNAFGTGQPRWHTKYSHSIVCEINPPFSGINRMISGAFAKDAEGKVYLLHRGRIGGGREGIGKTSFQDNYRGEWQEVVDGDLISDLALIASLDSPRFAQQVAFFVHEVERIKAKLTGSVKVTTPIQKAQFKEEFHGVKKLGATSKEIEARCDHGLVVNTLAKCLETLGITVGNTQNIDLYALDKQGDLKAMFEIKTSATGTDCYGAIGQLFFHSTRQNKKPRLFAVFPNDIDKESEEIMSELGIQCVTYRWMNSHPDFGDFEFKVIIE